MESFFANLFLDLSAVIKENIEEIEWIEQDFGQEVYDEWRANVAFPAVLIDFPNTGYTGMSELDQHAEAMISIRLLVAPFTQSYEGAPLEVRKDALSYFELEHKIVQVLQGWQPDSEYCQPLIRLSASSNNHNAIGLRIRPLIFTTGYQEEF